MHMRLQQITLLQVQYMVQPNRQMNMSTLKNVYNLPRHHKNLKQYNLVYICNFIHVVKHAQYGKQFDELVSNWCKDPRSYTNDRCT